MATFIKLTSYYKDEPLYINVDLATAVSPASGYCAEQGARGDINILGSQGGTTYSVTETPEQILALIQSAKEPRND